MILYTKNLETKKLGIPFQFIFIHLLEKENWLFTEFQLTMINPIKIINH